jgi:PASTA domain
MDKLVMPVAVAVLGALLVVALTPLGNGIRELLFPTQVTVVGAVTIPDTSIAGLQVALDGGDPRDADEAFRIPDVRAGEHRLELTSAGSLPHTVEFRVAQGAGPEQDLGEIELPPLVRLGHYQEPSAPARLVDYDFTIWLLGEPDALSRISAVTFGLPSPFTPPQVPGGGIQQQFCYRQTGRLAFEQLPIGGAPFTAAVQLTDGATFQVGTLSNPLAGLQPPDCPPLTSTTTPPPPPMPAPAPAPPPLPTPTIPATPTPSDSPSEETELTVPDVRGASVEQAREKLASFCGDPTCLAATISSESSDTVAEGVVISQDPEPGSQLTPGDAVALVVSEGAG